MTLTLRRNEPVAEDAALPGMIGEHPSMKDVYRLVRRVAPTDLPVLIVGETGTGKELVARAIHELSDRLLHPFVAVNAAAIPESLFESELFGHERGAFSDARAEKPGLLQVANKGSFFCDEVTALPSACQAKLLRAMEEGCVRRLGGLRPRPAAPRWVAACQRTDGLREDLRHRLTGVVVRLPPLRERASDIPALAWHFLARLDHGALDLGPDAMSLLASHIWPGNVRELRMAVCRAVVLRRDSVIDEAAIELALGDGAPSRAGGRDCSAASLQQVLLDHGGDTTAAARALGIARSTFYERLRRVGLAPPRRRNSGSVGIATGTKPESE